MISIHTSVDDLRSTFKSSIEYYTVENFESAIIEEEKGQKRVTVIKLLKRGLRMKELGARHI
jgi:hypothetical protein